MAAPAASQSRVLAGLALGAVAGSLTNFAVQRGLLEKDAVAALVKFVTRPVGDLFLHLLFMAIVPLVFASLAVGVTKLGGGNLGRIGAKTLLYFLITTAIAAAIGLVCVNGIRPGDSLPAETRAELMTYYAAETKDKLQGGQSIGIDTVVNIVPKNPFEALVRKDMLAIIFTALVTGIALTRIDPANAQAILDVLEGVNQIADFVIRLAMRLAPYAVFCLIFSVTAQFGVQLLQALAAFVLTVLLGLAIQLTVVFPILVRTLGGLSPLTFFRKVRGTMITAFSTSSSSATLPTAMKCAEEELGVPSPVVRFVLPLSASMNHNGTALFEGVTVMFLAQAFGIPLDIGQQLLVLLLCVVTATGMAGVPGGSLPLIGMVLATVGVPEAAIGIVIGIDRILDMSRTMVNVTGDLTTAVFVGHSEAAIRSAVK